MENYASNKISSFCKPHSLALNLNTAYYIGFGLPYFLFQFAGETRVR